MSDGFIALANIYLLHGFSDPSDEMLHRSAMFGLWMQETYVEVKNVIDLSEASNRWQRDGGENWRDEDSPFMIRKFRQEDRDAERRTGITWQPGAKRSVSGGAA